MDVQSTSPAPRPAEVSRTTAICVGELVLPTRWRPSAQEHRRLQCSVSGRSPPVAQLTVSATLRSLTRHANSGPNDQYPRYCRHSQRRRPETTWLRGRSARSRARRAQLAVQHRHVFRQRQAWRWRESRYGIKQAELRHQAGRAAAAAPLGPCRQRPKQWAGDQRSPGGAGRRADNEAIQHLANVFEIDRAMAAGKAAYLCELRRLGLLHVHHSAWMSGLRSKHSAFMLRFQSRRSRPRAGRASLRCR